MTLNNLLQPSDWLDTRKDRDQQLAEIFNITERDLREIRSEDRLIDRVMIGAELLLQRLLEYDVDPTVIPAQFTIRNLALLVDDGSYNRSPPVRGVVNAIKRRYPGISHAGRPGLNPTRTQFLREELGIYQGNLYEAGTKWEGFSVSEDDWLKDIRIPSKIGLEEAILLGILFSQGNLSPRNDQDRVNNRIELWGRNWDFEFYENVLAPLLGQIHNIIPAEPSDARRLIMTEGSDDGYTFNLPYYSISSLALVTWLQEDIGMSTSKEDRRIPSYIKTPEQKLGFLKGVIAGLGRVYVDSTRAKLEIDSHSPVFIQDLLRLSESLGYNPHVRIKNNLSNHYGMGYARPDVRDMFAGGLFINPHHIKQPSHHLKYGLLEQGHQA